MAVASLLVPRSLRSNRGIGHINTSLDYFDCFSIFSNTELFFVAVTLYTHFQEIGSVRISAVIPAVMSGNFHGFTQYYQADALDNTSINLRLFHLK
jgi:hypothetical protein